MNAKYAVKLDGETYLAIAKVVYCHNNPRYEFEAHVTFEDGRTQRYVLATSYGGTTFGRVLNGGDHVVVRFTPEDQVALLVPMDELASRLRA